jgi:IS605 OrfB family transposase
MIRSTQLTLKFSNQAKLDKINYFIDEYKNLTQFFIDYIWDNIPIGQNIPTLIPKIITNQANTWLSARAIQASAKQASSIVRGCRKKHEKRLFVFNKFTQEGKHRKARKLANIIKNKPISKPNLASIETELDERFVKFDFNKKTVFDGWITLKSLGSKLKIILPIKLHKQFNKLNKDGVQLKGIRLSKKSINVSFEIPDQTKTNGKIVGIDIGIKTAFTSSDNHHSEQPLNGHTIESVCKIISRRKKGSKRFKKACTHRKNLIGFYKNQLDWKNIKVIKIENIKNLRYKRRTSRYLSSFVYHEFFERLKQTAERLGVQVQTVCPTYTSQRCSCCGWTRKSNRNGKRFKCSKCGYTIDADLNGAINISLDLKSITTKERQKRLNLTGFYWLDETVSGQEFIVPVVQKSQISCFS